MRKLKGLVLSVAVAMLLNLYPSVSTAMDDILGLEEIMNNAEAVADDQLNEMRGGYIGGVYFSVYFTGYWNNAGEQAVTLDYDGNLEGSPETNYSVASGAVSGESVNVRAVVGGLNGAQGIFLISQVPGNLNIIHNNMIVRLAIINIMNSSQLNAARNAVSSAFLGL
jgi:hypothetical protein